MSRRMTDEAALAERRQRIAAQKLAYYYRNKEACNRRRAERMRRRKAEQRKAMPPAPVEAKKPEPIEIVARPAAESVAAFLARGGKITHCPAKFAAPTQSALDDEAARKRLKKLKLNDPLEGGWKAQRDSALAQLGNPRA